MARDVLVKICGIHEDEALIAAVEAGADLIGLVFYPPSPRFITFDAAAELTQFLPEDVRVVGLFVDPDDTQIETALNSVRLDFLQLHGRETVERVEAIRQEFGHPVIKSIAVETASDLEGAAEMAQVADWLLFDAKPPQGAGLPGGNAASFDWDLLKGRKWPCPWLLAGGLTAENVAAAIAATGATAVDVSSGVETAPGIKAPDEIRRFIAAAKG